VLVVAVVIGFASGSFFIGGLAGSADVISQQATLIHVFGSAPQAYVSDLSVVTAANRSAYRLSAATPSGGLEPGSPASSTRYEIDDADVLTIVAPMSLWGELRLVSENFIDTGLRVETVAPGARRIVNRSSLDLWGCRLIDGEGARDLPDVAAGGDLALAPSGDAGTSTPIRDRGLRSLARRATSRWGPGATGDPVAVCAASNGFAGLHGEALRWRHDGPAVVLFHLGATSGVPSPGANTG
jgi:hypothetical protein